LIGTSLPTLATRRSEKYFPRLLTPSAKSSYSSMEIKLFLPFLMRLLIGSRILLFYGEFIQGNILIKTLHMIIHNWTQLQPKIILFNNRIKLVITLKYNKIQQARIHPKMWLLSTYMSMYAINHVHQMFLKANHSMYHPYNS
jgi:hypothetical protein